MEFEQTRYLLCIAILLATPFFLVFGAWSDRIGRKAIMLGGMLLAILSYRPIYKAMYGLADTTVKTEITEKTSTGRHAVINAQGDSTIMTTTVKIYTDGTTVQTVTQTPALVEANKKTPAAEVLRTVWLPPAHFWTMMLLVFVQILYVTMVYGPIAAFLVELFPTRIRYTSMSLPYHIGNGIFGGLTPFIAQRLFDASKASGAPDPYVGLWYPMLIGGLCFVIGLLYLPWKNDDNVGD